MKEDGTIAMMNSLYIIGLLPILLIFIVLIRVLSARKADKTSDMLVLDAKGKAITIPLEEISYDLINTRNNMIEIKDQRLISRISAMVPDMFQTLTATQNAHQLNKLNKLSGGSEVLYRAILPKGSSLVESSTMSRAVRGFSMGKRGVSHHANFIPISIGKSNKIANVIANGTNIASLVVGQYYMSQISAQMNIINNRLTEIASFQNNEYKSKIMALTSDIKQIASFKYEILQNDENRRIRLSQLDNHKNSCTQLLHQANLMIQDCIKVNRSSFDKYDAELQAVGKWVEFQRILLENVYLISDLEYALGLGNISREQCMYIFTECLEESSRINEVLNSWHLSHIKEHAIDVESQRRLKRGPEAFISYLPGKFNPELKSKKISEQTANMILKQTGINDSDRFGDQMNLFDGDVTLIVDDGRLYYLPSGRDEIQ